MGAGAELRDEPVEVQEGAGGKEKKAVVLDLPRRGRRRRPGNVNSLTVPREIEQVGGVGQSWVRVNK